jgi:hypothetical protein
MAVQPFSTEGLEKWYSGFGFASEGELMVRQPNVPA